MFFIPLCVILSCLIALSNALLFKNSVVLLACALPASLVPKMDTVYRHVTSRQSPGCHLHVCVISH